MCLRHNKKCVIKESMDKTLPLLLKRIAATWPQTSAQYTKTVDGSFIETSYHDFFNRVLNLSAGLLALGHQRKDHIGLIADNRAEWLQTSFAIMGIGGADVPRGCDATADEISWILCFASCSTSFIENDAQAKKLLTNREKLECLKKIISFDVLSNSIKGELEALGFSVLHFNELLEMGAAWRKEHENEVEQELEKGKRDDLATIIFTSGTTGEPKGVMLSHNNFLSQLPDLIGRIPLNLGEKALSVLPVWHSFERLCEYVIIYAAAGIVYSKPIGSVLLADFAATNPQILPSVPRIWESVYDGVWRSMRKTGGFVFVLFKFFVGVAKLQAWFARILLSRGPWYNAFGHFLAQILAIVPAILLWPLRALGDVLIFRKIRTKLGTAFRLGVSGGGALPPNIDEFFWAIGVTVMEGYGLTETAPVVAVRTYRRPIFGTNGKALDCCEVKIVDEQGRELAPGKKGRVLVRGQNVMLGYYQRPELTKQVLSEDGWLDTGDLGFTTRRGEIILRGRQKDTIVLRSGENVEPTPIEMKVNESRYIGQSVVLGQDQRFLAALIVPIAEEIEAWADENHIVYTSYRELLNDPMTKGLIEDEVNTLVNARTGFKIFERINKIALLEKPFEVGLELSAKQEVMRHKLAVLYKKEIAALFESR